MFYPEYKALCLGKIKHNTDILHIFNDGGGCIMLWVCLSLARTREYFYDKKQQNTAKNKILMIILSNRHWESCIQEDNTLKQKAISILGLQNQDDFECS
jgi:hypothetical protein